MRLFGNMAVANRELMIGGISASALARAYGTPLYVMDEQSIRDTAAMFRTSFASAELNTGVIYAAKAFFCVAMAKLIAELGLRLDVVSGGELHTALTARFPAARIYYHGNNKSDCELKEAVDARVGTIVLDNWSEAKRLSQLLQASGRTQRVLLRLNPGIQAQTHSYIQTATAESKFGESVRDPAIYRKIAGIRGLPGLDLHGFHCHIGSQIEDEDTYLQTAIRMVRFAREAEDQTGVLVNTLNLGGGFGVYYTEADTPPDVPAFLVRYCEAILAAAKEKGLCLSELLIEPGRALVANAGITLYTVGDMKRTDSGLNYLFVDGGMTDNPRPALYQARYEAALANRMDEQPEMNYTIAGKLCESGDVLIRDVCLPKARTGDLLAVASTGAYNFSMSSNYNRTVRPAVVFVKNGTARLAVRRQSYEDLLAQDIG